MSCFRLTDFGLRHSERSAGGLGGDDAEVDTVALTVDKVPDNAQTPESISTILRRICRGSDRSENVELAWQLFREADETHHPVLRDDLPRMPTEAKPIIAATVARLEGRDAGEELERFRSTGRYDAAGAAGEALGRYLADPSLSGAKRSPENLLSALAHSDERVRRAALADLRRRNEPESAERLMALLLAEFPKHSPKVRMRRWFALTIGRGLATSSLIAFPILFEKTGAIIYAVGFFAITLLFVALEIWLLEGRNRLWSDAQSDILQCIGDLACESPAPLRKELTELKALGTGWHASRKVRWAAKDAVRRIESASQPVRDLPVVTGESAQHEKELPVPAQRPGGDGATALPRP